MKRLYQLPDDFEAAIRIYTEQQGGRRSPSFNGIRWDFVYADDPPGKELFVIHPDFFDEKGDSLPTDKPLSLDVELPARMTVLNDEMRRQIHRHRIRDGTLFYCHEGSKRVAVGRVTRITGLLNERP